jgi:hypothetical protein
LEKLSTKARTTSKHAAEKKGLIGFRCALEIPVLPLKYCYQSCEPQRQTLDALTDLEPLA